MQLRLQMFDREQVQRCWAFARKARTKSIEDSEITACSSEAREYGIRAGMCYEEAKLLLPDLKVLVYRGR